MGDNIAVLPVITTQEINPDRIIKGLEDANLDTLVALGFTEEGEFYFASNRPDAGTVIFLLEQAKRKLLNICDEMEIKE